MIGSFELPTFSNSHHHGAGFHGSPVEAKMRKRGKIVALIGRLSAPLLYRKRGTASAGGWFSWLLPVKVRHLCLAREPIPPFELNPSFATGGEFVLATAS